MPTDRGRSPAPALARLATSYRVRPAGDTVALAERLMPQLGISRVTDITRMDRLGLPVHASVRPRGLGLRVHAGKGVRPLESRAGALMEAVEHAAAEPQRSAWVARDQPVADVVRQFDRGLRFVDFVPILGLPITPDRVLRTVECERLGARAPVWLPAELVFFPYGGTDAAPALFGASTNGLASGNSLDEATLHGLLEVMERDALAMNKPRDASQWVEPASLPEPFRSLAEAWRGIGIELGVRHVPNAFDLPCFEATLHEPDSSSVNLAGGSGLHLDRRIALARAVCEAAQSRLSHIHGGRDDITAFYAKYQGSTGTARLDTDRQAVATLFDRTRRIGFDEVADVSSKRRSIAAVLADVLQILARAGFENVFRHCFRIDLNGLHVVKVIVPKCENVEDGRRRIGPRLLARILADA